MRTSDRRGRALLAATWLAVSTPTLLARGADPSSAELAAARELFEHGVQLEEAHDWTGALDVFRKVAAVKRTAAVQFHLGLCLENTGHLVDALNEFTRAEAAAGSDPGADGTRIADNSRRHVAELKARIPRVIVRLPPTVTDATVTLDGVGLAAALVGAALPVEPGAHVLTVTARDRASFRRSFELAERAPPLVIDVTLPLDLATQPPAVAAESPPPASSATARPWPWVVGAVGIGALAGGGVMYVLRAGAIDELEAACGSGHSDCPASKRPVYDRGRTYTWVGDALVGVGVAAVGTSIVLFALGAPRAPDGSASVRFVVGGAAPLGCGVVGAF